MKATVLLGSALTCLIGGAITFAIVRWLNIGRPELAFLVGAILGTQIAAVLHHRVPSATNDLTTKVIVGVTLALVTLGFGILLHVVFQPFKYVEVSVPIAVIGAFGFPLVLFDTMWTALEKAKKKDA